MGRTIRVSEQEMQDGENKVNWNGKDIYGNEAADGMYFAHIYNGVSKETVKLMKTK
jgi:hypothetical protein